MGELALSVGEAERFDRDTRCRRCGGSGSVKVLTYTRWKAVDCPQCSKAGTGRVTLADVEQETP